MKVPSNQIQFHSPKHVDVDNGLGIFGLEDLQKLIKQSNLDIAKIHKQQKKELRETMEINELEMKKILEVSFNYL